MAATTRVPSPQVLHADRGTPVHLREAGAACYGRERDRVDGAAGRDTAELFGLPSKPSTTTGALTTRDQVHRVATWIEDFHNRRRHQLGGKLSNTNHTKWPGQQPHKQTVNNSAHRPGGPVIDGGLPAASRAYAYLRMD